MTRSGARRCSWPGMTAAAVALLAVLVPGCASAAASSRHEVPPASPGGPVRVPRGTADIPSAPGITGPPREADRAGPGGYTPSSAAYGAARKYRATRYYLAVPEPARLRIPVIGVDTSLERLARLPDGTIAVPGSPDIAGWYQDGPRPGEPGPAVILGHIDSRTGPAVFYRLPALHSGDEISITRVDGAVLIFRVEQLVRVPKTEFPTDLVYLPTLDPVLRLVTCGGGFDVSTGHYRDNVVIFATLVH